MTKHVCNGALLKCSFGKAPGTLTVLPDKMVQTSAQPTATIMDNKPLVNIPCFGLCSSPANPAVAANMAIGAGAVGPCIPVIPAPWLPGDPTVCIKNQPVLTDNSKLICAYAGEISITMAGQVTVGKG